MLNITIKITQSILSNFELIFITIIVIIIIVIIIIFIIIIIIILTLTIVLIRSMKSVNIFNNYQFTLI